MPTHFIQFLELRDQEDIVACNAMFSFGILQRLLTKICDYEKKREKMSGVKYVISIGSDEILINCENIKFDFIILELNSFKNFYLEWIRALLDVNKGMKYKINELARLTSQTYNGGSLVSQIAFVLNNAINNVLEYLMTLQMLLDCVKLIKNSPKTKNNLSILFNICKDCFDFFREDKWSLKKQLSLFSPFMINFLALDKFLFSLQGDLEKVVNVKTVRQQMEEDNEWLIQGSTLGRGKGRGGRSRGG